MTCNEPQSYDSDTLKSSTRNASLAYSGSLFPKLSSSWGGFGNLIKMLRYDAVSTLGSCHQNFFESSTDQAGEPKTAMEVLEVRIPEADAWGHLSNASKTMKKRPTAVKTKGQPVPLKGDAWIVPTGHSHARVCTSSLAASTLLPIHTCRTDNIKAALPAVCRAWTSQN